MPINTIYRAPSDLPPLLPVFPLPEVLLLPRGEMPLNIFEPRYLAMIDQALASHRMIGMIQPEFDAPDDASVPPLVEVGCLGRITGFQETGDGRYLVTLTGICRFRRREEVKGTTPFRQVKPDYSEFSADLLPGAGEDQVDRPALMATLRAYLDANSLDADWSGIQNASNEALVNALSMMSPYGAREKQALLEAPDLKSRAEILVAITEMDLARTRGDTDTSLQ
ncbi:LON peptidase substrate-binding domain-containing protein [Terrihabitans rhizophilus]|jgi:Lon protease-like protein|uniref:LON peptidase substrate-binding domain-containing protein n=1 Tax=Terrihabitans rhizophilus TaxID=3092662 RepID=A0ABU4RV99_9HYPH|nr:LON peptidase substrate-binding domain-containing protein [Terrihabitans sp. PJ23]MDX6807555.1 LON peptidase substrate-binding domain-containing protein [Terrihabitans sp. PJ23]